jgi:hypothetical protein
MRDAHKEAQANYNALKEQYETTAVSLKVRTNSIIEGNENLQAQIKRHLEKAVGVSLFHAFDNRRGGLVKGKWIWAGVTLAAIVAGGLLSYWIAQSLGSAGVEPALFVKLSAFVPVSFGIFFAAKQYSNERRTEEEYAFKSAISLSLVPYKDLLQRMKSDGHEAQAAFVEKLLIEVFDNPVKRVYAEGSATESGDQKVRARELRQLFALAKNVDPERAQKLVELFADLGIPFKVGK